MPPAVLIDRVSVALGHRLTVAQRLRAQHVIHYGTGAGLGVAYDAAVRRWPAASRGRGTLAGLAIYAGTHGSLLPALDVNCKAHDLDNLYVVVASFFPSSSAVNPGLTTIASALRVGDHLLDRLGALPAASGETNGRFVRRTPRRSSHTRPSGRASSHDLAEGGRPAAGRDRRADRSAIEQSRLSGVDYLPLLRASSRISWRAITPAKLTSRLEDATFSLGIQQNPGTNQSLGFTS